MKKGLSVVINLFLFAVIVLLAIQVVKSIQAPIKFSKEQKLRETEVVENLIDIRNAQVLYKNEKGQYTASFDSLISFCQTAEIPIVKIVPDPTDTTFTRTINDTIGFVKVMDSLKAGREDFDISDIKLVPFSEPQQDFELQAGFIKRNGVDTRGCFEVLTAFNEQARACAPADTCDDGNGDGDHQRTWAADNQQGQSELDVTSDEARHQR